MSRVVNDAFEVGTAPTATLLNEKFTDIATLTTAAVDDSNVAEEGLDIEQLKYGQLQTSGAMRLVYLNKQSTGVTFGSGTAYPNTATRTVTEIAHGSGTRMSTGVSGVALEDGDVMEAHFSVLIDEVTATDLVTALAETFRLYPAWLVWLQWDITSNALANWTEVPKQGNFNTNYGADGAGGAYTVRGSSVAVVGGSGGTTATMPLPHINLFLVGGAVKDTRTQPASKPGGDDNYHLPPDGLQQMRSYFYKNETGSTITIYGLRLVIDGLYYPWYTVATPVNRFVHIETEPAGALGDDITLSECYIALKIQRGD